MIYVRTERIPNFRMTFRLIILIDDTETPETDRSVCCSLVKQRYPDHAPS